MPNNDIVLSLPFLTGFLFAFGGGAPIGIIKQPKFFRRYGIPTVITLFSMINYGYRFPETFLITPFYVAVLSMGYGKEIEGKRWLLLALLGAMYGGAGLPVFVIANKATFCGIAAIICGLTFPLLCWLSSEKRIITWKIAEGITGFMIGLLPALAMVK